MNLVGGAVAVDATSTTGMRTAIDRALHPAMAASATLRVSQRLKIGVRVFSRNIRVAIIAGQVGMWRRVENNIAMAALAVDVLCRPGSTQTKKNRPDKNYRGTVKATCSIHLFVPIALREVL